GWGDSDAHGQQVSHERQPALLHVLRRAVPSPRWLRRSLAHVRGAALLLGVLRRRRRGGAVSKAPRRRGRGRRAALAQSRSNRRISSPRPREGHPATLVRGHPVAGTQPSAAGKGGEREEDNRTVRMRTICRTLGLSCELGHIARRADLLGSDYRYG